MGYDMSILNPRESYSRMTVGRDNNYFRANIWGMSKTLRPAMDAAGILDWDTEHGKFPEEPKGYWDNYMRHETAIQKGETSMAVLSPEYAAFEVAHRGVLMAPSPIPGKIPGYKFCSNDGWIVTAEESKLIYEALKDFGRDIKPDLNGKPDEEIAPGIFKSNEDDFDRAQYVREFAEFCLRASEADGFEVN